MAIDRAWMTIGIAGLLAMTATAEEPEPLSHAAWTEVLQRFVDDRGLVDYVGLAADRETFDRYVRSVETISPRSHPELFPTREAALAYYVNAYNALVFKGVLARGPEDRSVWRGLVSGFTFFVAMRVEVGGEKTSLKALEDNVIRGEFEDPRIHAALNCASIGCPRLPREAFDPEKLDAQLDQAMTEFVSDSRHVRIEAESKTVFLSKIFDWFSDDFLSEEKWRGASDPNVLDYVNRYREPGAQIPRSYKITFPDYDKAINKQ